MAYNLKPCPCCGEDMARVINDNDFFRVRCDYCGLQTEVNYKDEEGAIDSWNMRSSDWHTGTPTETGLYVVLTEVVTIGIHSSKGTYLLDWWDGYCFKNLKGIVQNRPIHSIKEYSWIKWQKIEED